jgi:peroxiredoxin
LGADLVAISPQRADLNAEVARKHRLDFPVMTDFDNAYTRSLGLVYKLSNELAELYRGFGIDLPGNHATETWELPLATRMVVDRDGIIRAIDADPDYTIRPEPAATLEVLRGLS